MFSHLIGVLNSGSTLNSISDLPQVVFNWEDEQEKGGGIDSTEIHFLRKLRFPGMLG